MKFWLSVQLGTMHRSFIWFSANIYSLVPTGVSSKGNRPLYNPKTGFSPEFNIYFSLLIKLVIIFCHLFIWASNISSSIFKSSCEASRRLSLYMLPLSDLHTYLHLCSYTPSSFPLVKLPILLDKPNSSICALSLIHSSLCKDMNLALFTFTINVSFCNGLCSSACKDAM